jgi:hypothetical protein
MEANSMGVKHLLSGVAIVAALAIAGPVWAQNPSGGAPMAMPGPSGGAAAPATTSAAPPAHHAVRHARAMHAHHKAMARKAAAAGDTTAQLNREELARIQSGAPPAPMPAAPMAPEANPGGGNPMGAPGPNPGGPGLTPYSGGAPAH